MLCYRRHKLEAEIASMTWKVSWSDVICDSGGGGDGKGNKGRRRSRISASTFGVSYGSGRMSGSLYRSDLKCAVL